MANINLGHSAIKIPDDLADGQVAATPEPPPSTGEIQYMRNAQRGLFKVAVPSIALSAIGVINDLTINEFSENSSIKFLSITYAIVILITFFFGMLLLLLSVALPHLPISATVKTKLMWTVIGLIPIVLVLKMSILLGTYAISK